MTGLITSLALYLVAAALEIAGCFALWAVLRLHRTSWWLLPAVLALILFAAVLTRIDLPVAGRTYAAYGGIYILASMAWMWSVEGQPPTRFDIAGVMLCVIGAAVILMGGHTATGV